jgi:hypothetical protein
MQGLLALRFKNHLQDNKCTWSTKSPTLLILLLKIHSFLLFQTTHITVFQIKITPSLATLFLAHPDSIAMEICRFGGEIRTTPSQFITAYHTFETNGQWRNKWAGVSTAELQKMQDNCSSCNKNNKLKHHSPPQVETPREKEIRWTTRKDRFFFVTLWFYILFFWNILIIYLLFITLWSF